MAKRCLEKADETMTFRVSDKFAAGIRDRARFLEITPSALIRNIIENHFHAEIPSDRSAKYADLVKELKAAKGSIDSVLSKIELIKTGI